MSSRIKSVLMTVTLLAVILIVIGYAQKTHKVTPGDTLWDMAGKYYKNPWQWKKIYDANREKIENPDMIFPAQEFSIPGIILGTSVPVEKAAEQEEPAEEDELLEEIAEEEPAEEDLLEEVAEEDELLEEIAEEEPAEEELLEEIAEEEPAEEDELLEEIAEEESAEELLEETAEEEPAGEEELLEEVAEEGLSEEELEEQLMGELEEELIAEEEEETGEGEILDDEGPGIDFSGNSIVVPQDFSFDGEIIKDKEHKMLIAQTDTVYLNIGRNKGLDYDTECYILRGADDMGDVGYLVRKVGLLRVTALSDNTSTAVITRSFEPIKLGDYIVKVRQ